MKNNNKYKKGFSLPEVLMACAVLFILSAIAVPVYMNYVEKAEDAATEAHLKDFTLAVDRYYKANRSYPIADNRRWSGPWDATPPDDLRILSAYGFNPDRNIYLFGYQIMEVGSIGVSFGVKAFRIQEEKYDAKNINYKIYYYSGFTSTFGTGKVTVTEVPVDPTDRIPGWTAQDAYLFSSYYRRDWENSIGSFILNQK